MAESWFWTVILVISVLIFILICIILVREIYKYRLNQFTKNIHSLENFLEIYEKLEDPDYSKMRAQISKEIFMILKDEPRILNYVSEKSQNEHIDDIEPELLPKNQIIKVPHRFNILMSLTILGATNFTELRKILHMSAGNLKHHIIKMQEMGWVKEDVEFGDRIRQMIQITHQGKQEFAQYTQKLKILLKKIEDV